MVVDHHHHHFLPHHHLGWLGLELVGQSDTAELRTASGRSDDPGRRRAKRGESENAVARAVTARNPLALDITMGER
ncbi:MAG TPA: hypothetical protein VFJ96_09730 [Gemmatimonadaceae bacterium]|nr:hypothetical protein [Gemmatimonadaceae bacterium]